MVQEIGRSLNLLSRHTACCRYKKLWDQDKDAYIRRYEKANKPLSSYELDIKEYLNKEVGVVCLGS